MSDKSSRATISNKPRRLGRVSAMMSTLLMFFALMATAAATAQQPTPTDIESLSSWSRFRGPNGTGVVDDKPLPTAIGPKTNVRWKTPLPPGHSSPVLSRDAVFATAFEDEKLFTYAIDCKTGKIRWRAEIKRTRTTKVDHRNNVASATPAVDSDIVVVFFPDFGLVAYDHAGRERWRYGLGPFENVYGMGASPIIFRDCVYLPCDQNRDSFLLVLDKATGKPVHRVDRPYAKSGHCTPVISFPQKGAPQLILPGSFYLDAYDTSTAKRVWWVSGLSFEMKSTPVLDDGMIYINGYGSPLNDPGNQIRLDPFEKIIAEHDNDENGSISKDEMPPSRASSWFSFVDLDGDGELDAADWNYLRDALLSKNGMLAIRTGGRGDMTQKNVAWTYHRSIPQLPSPLLYRGIVYLLNDQGGRVTQLDPKTGKILERGRLKNAVDDYYASPVAGDGKIWFVGESGIVSVVKAGGGLESLATVQLEGDCYATPAIGDGCLFVRTGRALYCFGK